MINRTAVIFHIQINESFIMLSGAANLSGLRRQGGANQRQGQVQALQREEDPEDQQNSRGPR